MTNYMRDLCSTFHVKVGFAKLSEGSRSLNTEQIYAELSDAQEVLKQGAPALGK